MPPRRIALLLLVAIAGCRPGSSRSPDANAGDASPSPDASSADAERDADATSPVPAGTCATGERWDGRAEGCLYEHAGCCYDSPAALCAAAGCPPAQCRVLEVQPAQARCHDPSVG